MRTHVVSKLEQELIENNHPAFTKKGTGGTCVLKTSVAELYRRFAARCEECYPTIHQDEEKVDGVVSAHEGRGSRYDGEADRNTT